MSSKMITAATKREVTFKDGIVIGADTKLPLIDRLRILFGCKVAFQAVVETEYRIGKNRVQTGCQIQTFASRLSEIFQPKKLQAGAPVPEKF